jgi:FMN phosphatase YigB (HAD superfamily)
MDDTHKPIILWDVHEVLFTRNLVHWAQICLQYPHKWQAFISLDWHIIALGFRYFLHITHIKRAELTSQELIDYARSKKKQALVDLVIQVACDYTPIPGTIELVEQLHALGYTQHLASNLGPTVFEKFKQMYPVIFSYFPVIHLVYYDHHMLIKKPNPEFFVSYCTRNSIEPSNVIFIDDKDYNVKSAESIGMHGIVYRNKKDLVNALQKYNIPVH